MGENLILAIVFQPIATGRGPVLDGRRGPGWSVLRRPLLLLGPALLVLAGCGYSDPYAGQGGPVASMAQPSPSAAPGSDRCNEGASKKTITFPDGLQYADVKAGTGAIAENGANVTVGYTLFTESCSKVQSSKDAGAQPIQVPLTTNGGFINGFVEGVRGMRVGGTRRIVIPNKNNLSFPASSWPPSVPANSTVIFIVELQAIGAPTPTPSPSPS